MLPEQKNSSSPRWEEPATRGLRPAPPRKPGPLWALEPPTRRPEDGPLLLRLSPGRNGGHQPCIVRKAFTACSPGRV